MINRKTYIQIKEATEREWENTKTEVNNEVFIFPYSSKPFTDAKS